MQMIKRNDRNSENFVRNRDPPSTYWYFELLGPGSYLQGKFWGSCLLTYVDTFFLFFLFLSFFSFFSVHYQIRTSVGLVERVT